MYSDTIHSKIYSKYTVQPSEQFVLQTINVTNVSHHAIINKTITNKWFSAAENCISHDIKSYVFSYWYMITNLFIVHMYKAPQIEKTISERVQQ